MTERIRSADAMTATKPASQRGFALLIVLWSLTLLTLLVTQLGVVGRSETLLARNLLDAASAQASADGAIYDAASRLLDPSPRHITANGRPLSVQIGGAVAEIRIEDESGKIDPNVASSALLEALIRVVGANTETAANVASAIVQWRFPDANSQTPASIAASYRAAGKSYSPPFSAFQTLDEIGLVRTMSPGLLALLVPHLTIYSGAEPDPRAADAVVVAALRQAGMAGAIPSANTGARGIYRITADASASGGSRFHRTAILRLALDQNGAVYRVLFWQ